MIALIYDIIVGTLHWIYITVVIILLTTKHILRWMLPVSMKSKSLKGEIALVTGAGSGIGRLMAYILHEEGCRLVLWDINEEAVNETAQVIKNKGGDVLAQKVDLSKREDVYRCADIVKKEVGNVYLLINNAGIATGKKFMDTPDALAIKTMEVNCFAHFWTVKSFLPKMLEKNHGHIVTIASQAGRCGTAGLADYCASKHAAVGFDEALRMEFIRQGSQVKTTCVCPFYINTGMFTGTKTQWPRMIPILEPDYVASKIIQAVKTDQKNLNMPSFCYIVPFLRIFPTECSEFTANTLGIMNGMDDFVQTRMIDIDDCKKGK